MGTVFFIMGFVVCFIGLYNSFKDVVPSNYIEEKGRLVEIGKVEYDVDGRKYEIKVSSDKYYIGEIVDIMYNPKNPNECKIVNKSNDKWIAITISVIVGLVFAGMGVFLFKQGLGDKGKRDSVFE